MLLLLLLLLLLRVRPVSPRRASVSINDLRLRYGELAVGVGRAARAERCPSSTVVGGLSVCPPLLHRRGCRTTTRSSTRILTTY